MEYKEDDPIIGKATDRLIQSFCMLDRAIDNLAEHVSEVKDKEVQKWLRLHIDDICQHVFNIEFLSMGPAHFYEEAVNREMSEDEIAKTADRLFGDDWVDMAH
jgi:hypothetical protein